MIIWQFLFLDMGKGNGMGELEGIMKKTLIFGGTGLVGSAIANSLDGEYEVVVVSGHHEIENGYTCSAENLTKLSYILKKEQPDIIVSSILGDFSSQMLFHEELSDWIKENDKVLVYISTTNVFDGDLSKPVDEASEPNPESDYGIFKLNCEKMLQRKLDERLIILRLNSVWAKRCKRIERLKRCSDEDIEIETYPGDMISVTLAEQVGEYLKYILDNELSGVFHVGTEDMVDYHEFERMVCDRLNIPYPRFKRIDVEKPAYQAFLPTIRDIPAELRKSVKDVLDAIAVEVKEDEEYLKC